MPRGELFILSAPSGAGKTTLIQSLLQGGLPGSGSLAFSVSHTTRVPRAGEVDGRDYHFVSAATFQEMIDADRFLEWARVHDNLYGTSLDEVFPRLEQGIDVLLDIDVQGAGRVLQRCPDAHGIFLLPPSFADLEARLRQRGLDDDEVIRRRVDESRREIGRYDQYHYVIINDDARQAGDALAAIILEKRYRRERILSRVQDVLRTFQEGSSVPRQV